MATNFQLMSPCTYILCLDISSFLIGLMQVSYRVFTDKPEDEVDLTAAASLEEDEDEQMKCGKGFKAFLPFQKETSPTGDEQGQVSAKEGVCNYRGRNIVLYCIFSLSWATYLT